MIFPLAGILLFSKEIMYQAYTDLTTFTQALEVCLPAGAELSPQVVLQLLPFEPVAEQQLSGRILLASFLIVLTVSSVMKRQVIKKCKKVALGFGSCFFRYLEIGEDGKEAFTWI